MANPVPNEEKIYEMLKKEKITIDPRIWLLMLHHIRSDLQVIVLSAECSLSGPRWILKVSAFVGKLLYRIMLYPGNPPQNDFEVYDEILARVGSIDMFLIKLHETTSPTPFIWKDKIDISWKGGVVS